MDLQPVGYSADGEALNGFLADGSKGATAPGVLVAHESPGLTDHIKGRTRRLGELGYVAFALDLFGAHNLDLEEARKHSAHVVNTPGLMRRRAMAALETLAAQKNVDASRLAAVGFCLGGAVALELARSGAPIQCAVGYHPGFRRPAGSIDGPIRARVLMMIGDKDPVVPPDDRAQFVQSMTAAGADWQLHIYGGVGHSYTNPAIDAFGLPGFGYNAGADRRSWRSMLNLFEEVF